MTQGEPQECPGDGLDRGGRASGRGLAQVHEVSQDTGNESSLFFTGPVSSPDRCEAAERE